MTCPLCTGLSSPFPCPIDGDIHHIKPKPMVNEEVNQ